MALFDNAYSRFVAWVKIILPLAAIALLSMMFLFAGSNDPSQTIPFADIDVDQLARDQRLTNPTYAGVTSDGRAISFTASEVRGVSGQSDQLFADSITMRLTDPDGKAVEAQAPQALIDQSTRIAVLSGGVMVKALGNVTVETEGLRTDMTEAKLESLGDVRIVAPFGLLNAGQMQISTRPETGGYLVDFTKGVNVVYQPRPAE